MLAIKVDTNMTLFPPRISLLGRPGLLMMQKLEYHLYFVLRGNIQRKDLELCLRVMLQLR